MFFVRSQLDKNVRSTLPSELSAIFGVACMGCISLVMRLSLSRPNIGLHGDSPAVCCLRGGAFDSSKQELHSCYVQECQDIDCSILYHTKTVLTNQIALFEGYNGLRVTCPRSEQPLAWYK